MSSIAQQDFIRIKARMRNSQYGIVSASTLIELQRLADRPESMLAVLLEGVTYDNSTNLWGNEVTVFAPILSYNQKAKNIIFFAGVDSSTGLLPLTYMGSVANCETLVILEEASQTWPVKLRRASDTGYLRFANSSNVQTYVAVDGKYVSITLDSDDAIATLEVTDVAIPEGTAFVNITEADLMKLIGAPRIS